MDMNEFLDRAPKKETLAEDELDVQKAVVESLAAEKVEQDERITVLLKENATLKSKISSLQDSIEDMKASLAKVGDVLAANAETNLSNKLALLDRDPEIGDRFPGETRDHVLEVIREAREAAEKDGRLRRAQILESVLLANAPLGKLAKKREALQKIFSQNGNILSGAVIAELEKLGISHKNGENYLLPDEIIKRNY